MLQSAFNLALVVIGFGLVIVVHELGHFAAARWAGVRVDQFAVGFGSAIASYRRGLGWRRGSTAREYAALPEERRAGVSPTEYRLNWFPLGGYVKMLGQDDLAPTADSLRANPDSFAAASVPKRMIIISAGVVMNLILAASLFILVFMIGLRVESSVVGVVVPDSAAASAVASEPGTPEGLRPGDRIEAINSRAIRSFNDVMLAVAMARKDAPLDIRVVRDGRTIDFTATPRVSDITRLQEVGILPAFSGALLGAAGQSPQALEGARRAFEAAGLSGVPFGATLTRVGSTPVAFAHELERAVESAAGQPVRAAFQPAPTKDNPDPEPVEVTLAAKSALHRTTITFGEGAERAAWPVPHLLGIVAPVRVEAVSPLGEKSGLLAGDVFARVGAVEWPDVAAAVAEIRRHARKPIDLVVLRDGEPVSLRPTVKADGAIGFAARSATDADPGAGALRTAGVLLDRRPELSAPAAETLERRSSLESTPGARSPSSGAAAPAPKPQEAAAILASETLDLPPGACILMVNETPVDSFPRLREALLAATAEAHAAGRPAQVALTFALPLGAAALAPPGPDAPVETVRWSLSADAVASLHALGWQSPVDQSFFEFAQTTLKAKGPVSAMVMGVRETNRVMMTTYLTIRRLYEGSVKVEHLKGPVGIAHLGTMVAEQGFLHLLFFLALISVNLAVINFLPLPIVDGGQFVFLIIEGITRRPVSAAIQSAAIMLGVVLIGLMFVVVTFNDISALLGG